MSWGYTQLKLPLDLSRVQVGNRVTVQGSDDHGVLYRGGYYFTADDRPGDEVCLHFELDPRAKPGTVKEGVSFLTTWEWQQRAQAVPPEPQRPRRRCELALKRILSSRDERGPLELVRLCGADVPEDAELYFCLRTFTQLKVVVRRREERPGLVHEYAVTLGAVDDRGRGGIYELSCRRSAHSLQVKVQPALGLQSILPQEMVAAAPSGSGKLPAGVLADLLGGRLWALVGAYHLLRAFVLDPALEMIPLSEGSPGATKHVSRLASDRLLLQALTRCCSVLALSSNGGAEAVRLSEPQRPKTRGLLLKLLFEAKMALVRLLMRLDDEQLAEDQEDAIDILKADLLEDCCPGGPEAQFRPAGESAARLRADVCGDLDERSWDDAYAGLLECYNYAKNVVAKLRSLRRSEGLRLPRPEEAAAGDGVGFKNDFNQICNAAIHAYVHEEILRGLRLFGLATTLATIRKMWCRPDAHLRILCGQNLAVADELRSWDEALVRLVEGLRTTGELGTNPNPRGATGLENPGTNLCATNSMLQVLFSSEAFRDAVLAVPPASAADAAPPPLAQPGSAEGATGAAASARHLVEGLYRLFGEMADKRCASASAREIALVLYGRELGRQQDSDELLHRLSSLLEEGLGAIQGDPYGSVRVAFQRLFMGVSYEVQVRRAGADCSCDDFEALTAPAAAAEGELKSIIGYPLAEAACRKRFLSIPVQPGNKTIAEALEDFAAFSRTGGSDVLWNREQFRTLPAFLCFAIRQVGTIDWEEELNLTPFALQATPEAHRRALERASLRQRRGDLEEALQALPEAAKALAAADGASTTASTGAVDAESVRKAREVRAQLRDAEAKLRQLDEVSSSAGEGGLEDPCVATFLEGIMDPALVEEKICGFMGVNTVQKLSELFLGVDGASDMLEDLELEPHQVQALLGRLGERQARLWKHVYDLHAIIVYEGKGQVGHYVSFVRQSDGAFLCFDDEHVTELPDARKIRELINTRGSETYPASVRTLVYRRRGDAVANEPLELPGPERKVSESDEPEAKRARRD